MRKILLLVILPLLLAAGGYIWWNYFFVFGEGIKSGYLNYAVYKGNVFKTYEGKLIQEGFGATKTGTLKSNEFEFSIESEDIFRELEANPNKHYDLHYKEYHNPVPWRGNTKYIVDKIVAKR